MQLYKNKGYEIIPQNLELKIREVTAGERPEYYDACLRIIARIYYKSISTFGEEVYSMPFAMNYWRKLLGKNASQYLELLRNNNLIRIETRAEEQKIFRYALTERVYLPNSTLNIFEYKSQSYRKSDKSFVIEEEDDNDEHNKVEKELGDITRKHLTQLTFDYDAFRLWVNDFDFASKERIDISALPKQYNVEYRKRDNTSITNKKYLSASAIDKIRVKENLSSFYKGDYIVLSTNNIYSAYRRSTVLQQGNAVDLLIKHKHFYIARSKDTKRLYTTFSGISNYATKFLSYKDQELVEIDFKTSQFSLLLNLLNNIILEVDQTQHFSGSRVKFIKELEGIMNNEELAIDTNEINKLYNTITGSDFYNHIKDLLNLPNREVTKILCFKILFSRPQDSIEQRLFTEHLPDLMKVINAYKKIVKSDKKSSNKAKNKIEYNNLAVSLQSIEGELVIDKIVKELRSRRLPFLTKHDAIYTTSKHYEEIKQITRYVLMINDFSIQLND